MSSIERLPRDGNICLIDADSLIYYEMQKPTLAEALLGIDQRIATMLGACNTSQYCGFLTEKNCFRYGVTHDYKGNRKGKAKPIVFPAIREYLIQNHNFFGIRGFEADDLVSYYSYTDKRSTIICSPDKDVLYQCVGMHYNYQKNEFLHTTPDEALKFLWKQVLMGDSTDNIQGIPGVGDKTSENWLKNRKNDFEAFALKKYVEKFGMVEGIMNFHKAFRLVYLLKTPEDVVRETEMHLPTLEINTAVQEDELW